MAFMASQAYFTYILYSQTLGRYYTGSAANLQDRLHRHNTRQCRATKAGAPWNLVYSESHTTRSSAMQRELYFKTGAGRDELQRLIAEKQTSV